MKGTGAERLMFSFTADGEPLKVYGRKFPVFDNKLVKRKQWGAVVQTAKPIVYLPFTEDTFDPGFVSGGKEFLVATARKALEELRAREGAERGLSGGTARRRHSCCRSSRHWRSSSRPTTGTTCEKQAVAFDEVLSQYGLKEEEAYRYSVSSAKALGPMQFTNRRGQRDLLAGGQALPRRKARPGIRERRHESAERHEGGDLPAGSGDWRGCGQTFARRIRRIRSCWESFLSPLTTADREMSKKLYRC